ncbi:ABC transporter ATP-binding protein [Bacillus sp. CGMCC 1.60114]|uniref:ABC transporter ATP-binding protein n=1 Tax=unclassified Bacillus (in: firmicutes) TaxID=185979 RepID=UPI00363447C1
MIKISRLTKIYESNTKALEDINLSLTSSNIVGFIGRNGAGKTTLLEIIAGLLSPTTGEIVFQGDLPKNQLIGYMEDNPSFYEQLTVFEMIQYINLVRRLNLSTKELENALIEVELLDKKDTFISGLSRGMKQRLGYIIATLHLPKILLLDEPFTGLDPHHLKIMKTTISSYARAGNLILFSTHIFSFAAQLCDQLVFINEGRIGSVIDSVQKEKWDEERINQEFERIITR